MTNEIRIKDGNVWRTMAGLDMKHPALLRHDLERGVMCGKISGFSVFGEDMLLKYAFNLLDTKRPARMQIDVPDIGFIEGDFLITELESGAFVPAKRHITLDPQFPVVLHELREINRMQHGGIGPVPDPWKFVGCIVAPDMLLKWDMYDLRTETPDDWRKIMDEGHEVWSHTDARPYLWRYRDGEMDEVPRKDAEKIVAYGLWDVLPDLLAFLHQKALVKYRTGLPNWILEHLEEDLDKLAEIV